MAQDFRQLARSAAERIERFHSSDDSAVQTTTEPSDLRRRIAENFCRFEEPMADRELLDRFEELLTTDTVHITHPGYFGLFNPNVTPASVAGDIFAAGFNPQLAAWSHAPFANEIEKYVLGLFAERLGLTETVHANFTSGGAEANHTAIATALGARVPGVLESGLQAAEQAPTFYASKESHHSVVKIAMLCGLGARAVRSIEVDDELRMDPTDLHRQLERDRSAGRLPFAVVATAGTTGAGAIDPLPELADLCDEFGLWMHVDAAWAGALSMSSHRRLLAGTERADSITWDAHKWLSVPMGAGMFFCRHPEAVHATFGADTPYMPSATADAADPYATTMQWSRRAIGLKVAMSLASLGFSGYREQIDGMIALGQKLRQRLEETGWSLVNHTQLPIVCFTSRAIERRPQAASMLCERLPANLWISPIALSGKPQALRACITNKDSTEQHVEQLVAALGRLREELDL